MIKEFFQYFSWRNNNENDLSDVTWALCNSSASFRAAFLNFFFGDSITIDESIRIEREKAEGDSRPDFVIESDQGRFIIENKIYDQNQHFGQYDLSFKVAPNHFGYITNYVINDPQLKSQGYELRTWKELYDRFIKMLPEDGEDHLLWTGYLEYIKNVCNIVVVNKMDLSQLFSLYSFVEVVSKQLCCREEQNFILSLYNVDRQCNNGYAINGITGVNFKLVYKSSQDSPMWGWVGIYYNRETPEIGIGFHNTPAWGKPYIDLLERFDRSQWVEPSYSDKPYFDECILWFNLKKDHFAEFNQMPNLEDQIKLLKGFMDEVILYPFRLSDNTKN